MYPPRAHWASCPPVAAHHRHWAALEGEVGGHKEIPPGDAEGWVSPGAWGGGRSHWAACISGILYASASSGASSLRSRFENMAKLADEESRRRVEEERARRQAREDQAARRKVSHGHHAHLLSLSVSLTSITSLWTSPPSPRGHRLPVAITTISPWPPPPLGHHLPMAITSPWPPSAHCHHFPVSPGPTEQTVLQTRWCPSVSLWQLEQISEGVESSENCSDGNGDGCG